jgi:hypothetical protein
MIRSWTTPLAAIAVLSLALAGGWFATRLVQQRDAAPVSSSAYAPCLSLAGSVDQVDCLSDRFVAGAADAARGLDGAARSAAVNDYVRAQEREAARDPLLAGRCHPAMHELGRSEGRRAATLAQVPDFPDASSQLCTAGYVHGLAEGYLVSTPASEVAAVFPKFCHEAGAREGCAHGVGHALLRARVDDRPVAAARGAIERCQDLPGNFPVNCTNGVYMELAMRSEPSRVDSDTYVATCRDAPGVVQELSCWSYLGLNLSTNDVPASDQPAWCAKASLPGQFQCLEEYGRIGGVEQVAGCGELDVRVELQRRCIVGAIGLQVGSGHVSLDDARTACDPVDPAELATFCRDTAARFADGRATVESREA